MSINEVKLCITNSGGLRTIAFDNPQKKNAINTATYVGLTNAINLAAADDSVKVLVLTGNGEYFSSGNDIGNSQTWTDLEKFADHSIVVVRNLTHAFIRFPKLFIAVINGPCIGIAATLIAMCDVIYATNSVYISYNLTILFNMLTHLFISIRPISTLPLPHLESVLRVVHRTPFLKFSDLAKRPRFSSTTIV